MCCLGFTNSSLSVNLMSAAVTGPSRLADNRTVCGSRVWALKRRGVTGATMLVILETRLDSVVYHLGFSNTRAAARQMITHGHIKVNGRKVNIPSYGVKVNDLVEVRESSVSRQMAMRGLEISTSRAVPDWLTLNKEGVKGSVSRLPAREDIQPIANEQSVVEFYSR